MGGSGSTQRSVRAGGHGAGLGRCAGRDRQAWVQPAQLRPARYCLAGQVPATVAEGTSLEAQSSAHVWGAAALGRTAGTSRSLVRFWMSFKAADEQRGEQIVLPMVAIVISLC